MQEGKYKFHQLLVVSLKVRLIEEGGEFPPRFRRTRLIRDSLFVAVFFGLAACIIGYLYEGIRLSRSSGCSEKPL